MIRVVLTRSCVKTLFTNGNVETCVLYHINRIDTARYNPGDDSVSFGMNVDGYRYTVTFDKADEKLVKDCPVNGKEFFNAFVKNIQ